MLSVIVPVYNVKNYLCECIDSIVSQTYEDLEIILVDDGSTDGSGNLCDIIAQKDKRIRVIHQENKGLSGARNSGLAVVTGDFVTFVDSDDVIVPQTYELAINVLASTNVDLLEFGFQNFTEPNEIKIDRFNVDEASSGYKMQDVEAFWKANLRFSCSSCNRIYRSEFLKDVRFPQGLIHGEDRVFNLLYLTKIQKGIFIRKPLYYYRKRVNSITRSAFNPKTLNILDCARLCFEITKRNMPQLLDEAELHIFRSYMDVLRKMVLSKARRNNENLYVQLREYVCQEYLKNKRALSIKERAEASLFLASYSVWSVLERFYFTGLKKL